MRCCSYVVDVNRNNVQKFTSSGTFVWKSGGTYGTGDGQVGARFAVGQACPIQVSNSSQSLLQLPTGHNKRVAITAVAWMPPSVVPPPPTLTFLPSRSFAEPTPAACRAPLSMVSEHRSLGCRSVLCQDKGRIIEAAMLAALPPAALCCCSAWQTSHTRSAAACHFHHLRLQWAIF